MADMIGEKIVIAHQAAADLRFSGRLVKLGLLDALLDVFLAVVRMADYRKAPSKGELRNPLRRDAEFLSDDFMGNAFGAHVRDEFLIGRRPGSPRRLCLALSRTFE